MFWDKMKKAVLYVSYLAVGVFMLYTAYSVYHMYWQSEDVFKFIENFWSYSFYKSKTFNLTLGRLLLLIGFLVLSFFLARFLVNQILRRILNKTRLDIGAKSAIENLTSYLLTAIFILIALSIAEVPLAAFTFVGGALAIGVGFGTQNILNNFISGIILQIEKPIKVGDMIELDSSVRGSVTEIGTRSTKIRLPNQTYTIVPNSVLLERVVNNWNLKDQSYRSKVSATFHFENDHNEVLTMINGIVTEYHDQFLNYPAPQIFITEFNIYGFVVEIFYWVDRNKVDRFELESEIRFQILEKSRQNKFRFATMNQ